MEHYICPGTCSAVSDEQKSCLDKNCPHFGQPFQLCECTDDRHGREADTTEYEKLNDQWEI